MKARDKLEEQLVYSRTKEITVYDFSLALKRKRKRKSSGNAISGIMMEGIGSDCLSALKITFSGPFFQRGTLIGGDISTSAPIIF